MMRLWPERWWWSHVARSSSPIFVGPFRTEVGFEVLYFLPWLAKQLATYQIARDRLIVVSRGGAGAWYGAGASEELYAYTPIAAVRQAMLADAQRTGSVKHQAITTLDTAIVRLVAEARQIDRYHVIHPSLMYQALSPWWDGQIGLAGVMARLQFETAPLPTPAPPLAMPLPERFLAVGFYARHTWPMTLELKDWVRAQVEHLATQIPVVLIESGLHADDHIAFPVSTTSSILSTAPYVTMHTNLAVQSAVMAKAVGFVGTYGGLQQLAVRLQKPSLGFFDTFEGTCYAHKMLTEWLAVQQKTPCFIGRPQDARYVREVLAL